MGFVGVDGLIYVGFFDVIYLVMLLGMVVMVVVDEVEFVYMVVMVVVIDDCLSVFCYL